jgi:Flp pilus assembly pilin Flp
MEKTMDKKSDPAQSLSLLADERGLTTVEYIIILCLVAVVGFGVWKKFGESVSAKVTGATTQVDSLPTEPAP